MNKNFLTPQQFDELEYIHKNTHDKRIADRVKVVIALNNGYSYEEIKNILLIDDRSAKRYKKIFLEKGTDGLILLNHKGGIPKMTKEQERELSDYLDNRLFPNAFSICDYINKKYNIHYTPEGLVITLHRLGYSYKKTKKVPSKANKENQEEFVEKYYKIKKNKKETEKIYFMDGVHPTHNMMPAYAWIRKGVEKYVKSNTGRQRININAIYSPEDHEIIYIDSQTIDSDSTIELLKKAEFLHPELTKLIIIRDNAKYYCSEKVKEYLKMSKVDFVPLPSYSPNLNLIERLWKLLKKEVMYNKYYEKFLNFRMEIFDFLDNCNTKHIDELKSLMNEKFHIFESS